jgi:tryptophan synthase alpha chain
VGFGISSAEHAVQVALAGADGVIIGSRVVKLIEDNLNRPEIMKQQVADFIRQVKTALEQIEQKRR